MGPLGNLAEVQDLEALVLSRYRGEPSSAPVVATFSQSHFCMMV